MDKKEKQEEKGRVNKKISSDKNTTSKKNNARDILRSDIKKNITAILLIVFSLLFLLSLVGQAGVAGNYINNKLGLIFGWSKFFLPILLLVLGVVYFRRYDKYRYYLTTVGAVIFIFFLASLMHNFYELENMKLIAQNGKGGGYIGFGISFILVKYTGLLAAYVISLGFFLIGLILTFNFPLSKIFKKFNDKYFLLLSKIKNLKFTTEREKETSNEKKKTNIKKDSIKFSEDKVSFDDHDKKEEKNEAEDYGEIISRENKKQFKEKNGNWRLPPLSLLRDPKKREEPKNLDKKAELIIKTLADFGIDVYFKGYNVGPSMVQYAFEPAKGVRLSKIITLQNNLAMALATPSIRIEAPISGKSLVGIELPLDNEHKEEVRIKSIL